jgi:hypothetical protein
MAYVDNQNKNANVEVDTDPATIDAELEEEEARPGNSGFEGDDIGTDGTQVEDVNNVSPAGLFSDVPPAPINVAETYYQRGYREAWEKVKSTEGSVVPAGEGPNKINWEI